MYGEIPSIYKYVMVGSMLFIFVGIIAYLAMKTFAARTAYLKAETEKEKEGHAKMTIMEEQEDLIIDKMTEGDSTGNESTLSKNSETINPDLLWEAFFIEFNNKKNMESGCSQGAQLKACMYYQTFAKYFKVRIISISMLQSYQNAVRTSIKLKILILDRTSGRKLSETTNFFDMEDEINVNQKFLFKITEEELRNSILYISMLCKDIFFKENLLGAVSIDLGIADYRIRQNINEEILPVKKDINIYGYLLLSLCHVPSMERLSCVIICGKDLKLSATNKSILDNVINPYVKLSLLNNGKLIKNCQTDVVLENNNPTFNEMVEFYITEPQLMSSDILLMVLHKDSNEAHQTVGRLLIGNHASGELHEHWNEAISNPENAVTRWHPIMR